MTRFDALREMHPTLGFALYALEPGGVVTLEILDGNGDLFSFTGATAEACLAAAFPEPVEPVPVEPEIDVLD